MTKFALKGLLGRKLRTALTAFAIVLGVAMVSGTYVLTDSIDKAFDSIFTESRAGSTAVITGKSAFDISEGSGASRRRSSTSRCSRRCARSPASLQPRGASTARHRSSGTTARRSSTAAHRTSGFSIANGDSVFNPLTLVEGDWPGPGEVAIDEATADKEDFAIGREVGVQGDGPVERLRISGFFRFGSVSTIGGATFVGFDLPTAQRIFDKEGKLDEIAVAAEPGTTPAAARPGARARSCPLPRRSSSPPSRQRRTRQTPTSSSRSCRGSCSPLRASRSSSAAS